MEILIGKNFQTCHTFLLQQLLGLRLSKVPDQIINDDKETLKQTHATYPKLNNIICRAESLSSTVSLGLNRGETRSARNSGIMYKEFTKGNKVTSQVVVPQGFRANDFRPARETVMAGHLGIKKSLYRVVAEFYWPGDFVKLVTSVIGLFRKAVSLRYLWKNYH